MLVLRFFRLSQLPQHRNRPHLLHRQVFPHDPTRALTSLARDDLLRRDDQVDAEVMLGLGDLLLDDLKLVHRRHDGRFLSHQPGLDEQRDFEVGVVGPLADASSGAVDGHAAADDDVYRTHLIHTNAAGDLLGALTFEQPPLAVADSFFDLVDVAHARPTVPR